MSTDSQVATYDPLGWAMIGATDRNKTNQLLLQVFIGRFNSSSFLPPVSGVISGAGGEWRTKIESFLLSEPRLYFESTGLNDSKANLKMQVLGGNQIEEKFINGNWQAQSIEYISPAQGPELLLNLMLPDAPVVVGKDDSLFFDLKNSDDFVLTSTDEDSDENPGGIFSRFCSASCKTISEYTRLEKLIEVPFLGFSPVKSCCAPRNIHPLKMKALC